MVEDIICFSCHDVMDSDDEFLEIDGHSFCGYDCANNKGYIECMVCDEYFNEATGHSFEMGGADHQYCSDDCLKDNNIDICYDCDSYVDGSDAITTVDDTVFCSMDCANNSGFYECERCDDVFEDSNGEVFVLDGEEHHFCSSDCRIEEGYEYCHNCSNYFNRDYDGIFLDNELYCSAECAGAEKCDNCGDYQFTHEGITTQENYFYCGWDCAERQDIGVCQNCNDFYDFSSNGVTVNESDYYCSEDCSGASQCYGCDKYFYSSDLTEFDGEVYCSCECADAVECCNSNCDGWVSEDNSIVVNNNHGSFSYCSIKCAKEDGFICYSCNKEINFEDVFVEFTDSEGNDLVFCDGLCAKEKEILECSVCEDYETYNNSYILEDKVYCSSKCYNKKGFINCKKCSEICKLENKNNLCEKCFSVLSNLSSKDIYNAKYSVENLDSKIKISNNLYISRLDNDKKKTIINKYQNLKSLGFYDMVNLIPYKQDKLGPYSFRYNIPKSNNFILLNISTVILVRPNSKELIEICDLTRENSNRELLNEFIKHGNHKILDIFNVLNDDRRSIKVFFEDIKKYMK